MAQEAVQAQPQEAVRGPRVGFQGNAGLWIAGALFVIGLGLWIWQVTAGTLAYHAQYAWGIYIPAFFTIAAMAMGTLIIAGIGSWTDGKLGLDVRKMYIAAIGFLVAAGFIITADLGRPLEVLRVMISGGITVPIFWDFWVLLACLVVSVIGAANIGSKRAVGTISIIAGLALLFVESWLAASSGVQELWASTIGGSTALAQVVALGLACVLLVNGKGASTPIRWATVASLVLVALMVFLNMVVGSAGTGRLAQMWAAVTASPWFWIGIVLGIVAPVVFLFLKGQKPEWMDILVGGLIIFGAFCMKLCFIVSSQYVPAIDALSVTSPETPIVEVVVTIGFAALGYIVYKLGIKIVKEGKDEQ